ncbi:hypothetical protein [Isoalcanivorax indicus]|uniref:hypothetical protein n=1 Tax=Isoalcanivorax indicus TaxID=2202653 RepID=UPI001FE8C7CC|nr:hypothetical protein [Isoalcanivorax indicus]
MSEDSYMMAWLAYLGAAAVIVAVIWWLTVRWTVWLKLPLRALSIAVLFTPWLVSEDTDTLAPAWIITLFDALIQAEGQALRAGLPLLAACVLALLLGGLVLLLRRRL